jgi:hypothetical protein
MVLSDRDQVLFVSHITLQVNKRVVINCKYLNLISLAANL